MLFVVVAELQDAVGELVVLQSQRFSGASVDGLNQHRAMIAVEPITDRGQHHQDRQLQGGSPQDAPLQERPRPGEAAGLPVDRHHVSPHIDAGKNRVGPEKVVVEPGFRRRLHRLQIDIVAVRVAKDRELAGVLDNPRGQIDRDPHAPGTAVDDLQRRVGSHGGNLVITRLFPQETIGNRAIVNEPIGKRVPDSQAVVRLFGGNVGEAASANAAILRLPRLDVQPALP